MSDLPEAPPQFPTRVCAVVITYNPHHSFVSNAAAIGSQVEHVVVVDNGSSGDTEARLVELEERKNLTVIRNDANLGIAAALNVGVKWAMERGFDWIATFDQDSRVSEGFIGQMLMSYHQASNPEKVAIIAASYVDGASGAHGALPRTRSGRVLTTMTSGSMMPRGAIEILGSFDETLYMDYVDTEFCLRAWHAGMRILQSPAVLFHSLGRFTPYRLLGCSFGTTNHSAARRYYITRNRLRLLGKYYSDWPWAWREVKAMLAETAKIALVEDAKWSKLGAIAAGTMDALRVKTGKKVEL